jgi:hypothetical protein
MTTVYLSSWVKIQSLRKPEMVASWKSIPKCDDLSVTAGLSLIFSIAKVKGILSINPYFK